MTNVCGVDRWFGIICILHKVCYLDCQRTVNQYIWRQSVKLRLYTGPCDKNHVSIHEINTNSNM